MRHSIAVRRRLDVLAPDRVRPGRKAGPAQAEAAPPPEIRDADVRRVLLSSSLIGFLIGVFVVPRLLFTLESAQVVAGVVELPRDNPMRIFDTSAYSLFLIQLPALLLDVGVSEWTLSVLLSGLQSALAFSAVALCTLVFSRNAVVALLAPLLLMRLELPGHKYPMVFPNSANNAGLAGFYAVLLVLALLSLRRARAGAFLLGLAPSVNVALGIAGWVGAAAGIVGARARSLGSLVRAWRYLGAGFALFAATFLVQFLLIRDVPGGIDAERSADYTRTFVNNWDPHRQSADFDAQPSRLPVFFETTVLFGLLVAAALTVFRRELSAAGRFLLFGLLGTSAVALAYLALDELFASLFPLPIEALMITRWLNLNSVVFPVLVVGLLGYLALQRRSVVAALTLLALTALVAVKAVTDVTAFRADGLGLRPGGALWEFRGLAFPAAALILLALLIMTGRNAERLRAAPAAPRRLLPGAVTAALGLCALAMLAAHARDAALPRVESELVTPGGAATVEILERAGRGEGLLITGPAVRLQPLVEWPQLRSKRGVLLDTWLMDVVSYAPEAAPGMEAILNRVYGTSIRNPAAWGSFDRVERLWEKRGLREWRAIRAQFDASDVLVSSEWRLKLPRIARTENLGLYHIP